MEFWDGCDLRKMLDRGGETVTGTGGPIALQITEGLQYLHERPQLLSFLYRDLKPENIHPRGWQSRDSGSGCLWNREQDWSGAGNRSFSSGAVRAGEIPGEESDVYAGQTAGSYVGR